MHFLNFPKVPFRTLKTLPRSRFREGIDVLKQKSISIFVKKSRCAQSIPRLEKPKKRRFFHKNPKMFDFRFNTPIPFLNQGQEILKRKSIQFEFSKNPQLGISEKTTFKSSQKF